MCGPSRAWECLYRKHRDQLVRIGDRVFYPPSQYTAVHTFFFSLAWVSSLFLFVSFSSFLFNIFFLSYFHIFFPYLFVIYNSSKAHDTHHIGMLIILCDFVCVVCMYLCCTCSAGKGLREL